MPMYRVTKDGVLTNQHGQVQARAGRYVSLSAEDRERNGHLFAVDPPLVPEPVKVPEPPLAEIMKPVRHTPKAEPVRKTLKR